MSVNARLKLKLQAALGPKSKEELQIIKEKSLKDEEKYFKEKYAGNILTY